eukprot:3261571-Rhodomonas_salina.1
MELSVTTGLKKNNIDVEFYAPRIDTFLGFSTMAGVVGNERGFKQGYDHFQGVIRMKVKSAREARTAWMRALGW